MELHKKVNAREPLPVKEQLSQLYHVTECTHSEKNRGAGPLAKGNLSQTFPNQDRHRF